jgi:tetratricopeptide (TPR) repeat protein
MKDSLGYIDSYFKEKFSNEELKLFDQRIIEDPVFAEELAFYLSSVHMIKSGLAEEKKKHFREIYDQNKTVQKNQPVRKLMPYLSAAAAVAAIALAIFLFYPVPSPPTLADKYMRQHLYTLGVMMNSREDSVQTAIRIYNEGKLNDALRRFEDLILSHPSEFKIKEYAGIVSLRLGNYDKALKYFRDLEGYKRLYANPGKFYIALTLLKRNLPGDTAEAKALLRQVVNDRLQNDADAKELLENL